MPAVRAVLVVGGGLAGTAAAIPLAGHCGLADAAAAIPLAGRGVAVGGPVASIAVK
ncbi:hypothetical protein [Amycolatopsis sp. NPDC098790]|uniref:hypothetical protein n=1 Tax=Amycolatopsis sp. NPDC098790 TaxID=3363939 RepID=UPI0038297472